MKRRNKSNAHKQPVQRSLKQCVPYKLENNKTIVAGCCTVGPIGPPDPPPNDPPEGNNQTSNSGGN